MQGPVYNIYAMCIYIMKEEQREEVDILQQQEEKKIL